VRHPRESGDLEQINKEKDMSKVTVDASTCVGCGLCEQSCPDVFEVQGDGIAHVKAQVCIACNLQEVADSCPVNSIKIS